LLGAAGITQQETPVYSGSTNSPLEKVKSNEIMPICIWLQSPIPRRL